MMLSSPLDLALFLMVLRVELQGVTSFIFFLLNLPKKSNSNIKLFIYIIFDFY